MTAMTTLFGFTIFDGETSYTVHGYRSYPEATWMAFVGFVRLRGQDGLAPRKLTKALRKALRRDTVAELDGIARRKLGMPPSDD